MKYRSVPTAVVVGDDNLEGVSRTADTIFVSGDFDGGRPTGLWDAKGNPIYRFRDPMGFQRR